MEAAGRTMGSLKKEVAVVTGASSGIGRAIAVALAGQGAEICLVARRRELLNDVAKEVVAVGSKAHVFPVDITEDGQIGKLGEKVGGDFGKLNILVLCGGAIAHGPLEKSPLADLDAMYRANVRGHLAVVQTFLPLVRKCSGQIVFINSSAGLRSPVGAGQFSATQHAFRALADTLRDEVNDDGVRVLSVYPGRTATPRIEALFREEGRAYKPEALMQPEDVAVMVVHSLSLPRTAEVTDISIRPMLKSY
jgi:NADP-dependent 3-hydroxy acid dehydrogenase YdfG